MWVFLNSCVLSWCPLASESKLLTLIARYLSSCFLPRVNSHLTWENLASPGTVDSHPLKAFAESHFLSQTGLSPKVIFERLAWKDPAYMVLAREFPVLIDNCSVVCWAPPSTQGRGCDCMAVLVFSRHFAPWGRSGMTLAFPVALWDVCEHTWRWYLQACSGSRFVPVWSSLSGLPKDSFEKIFWLF